MLKRVARRAGIDSAVGFSLLNKGTTILCSVVTLALVVIRFPADFQGYYYTFSSLLVLQTFLEFGMGIVLAQFVSHEWSKLRLSKDGRLEGDPLAIRRLGSLMRVGLAWYTATSVLFFIVVGSLGTLLLTRRPLPAGVLIPWWLLCFTAAMTILQTPLKYSLEGSDQIARSQRIAAGVYVTSSLCGWVAILSGMRLYAMPVASGVTAALGLILFGSATMPFLAVARMTEAEARHSGFSWRREFWPQQWRIALSWICGFFVYQSFVPTLYYFRGPTIAGQMGASMQLYNAVNTVASSWINSRGPRMGILGAGGRFAELRQTIRSASLRSAAAALICSVGALAVVEVLRLVHYKSERFIGIGSIAILLLALIVLQRVAVETLAIRYQKIEPFVVNSVAMAFLVLISNMIMGKYFGVSGVTIAFAIIMVSVNLPWVHAVFKSNMMVLERRALQSRNDGRISWDEV